MKFAEFIINFDIERPTYTKVKQMIKSYFWFCEWVKLKSESRESIFIWYCPWCRNWYAAHQHNGHINLTQHNQHPSFRLQDQFYIIYVKYEPFGTAHDCHMRTLKLVKFGPSQESGSWRLSSPKFRLVQAIARLSRGFRFWTVQKIKLYQIRTSNCKIEVQALNFKETHPRISFDIFWMLLKCFLDAIWWNHVTSCLGCLLGVSIFGIQTFWNWIIILFLVKIKFQGQWKRFDLKIRNH